MILGKNENPIIWEKNILEALKDLSDIEFQKLAWAGKHPVYILSFTEVIAQLYDTLDFERFMEYYNSLNNSDNTTYKLCEELNKMIKDFSDYGYSTELKKGGYNIILSDNRWIDITKKAKKIVELFDERDNHINQHN